MSRTSARIKFKRAKVRSLAPGSHRDPVSALQDALQPPPWDGRPDGDALLLIRVYRAVLEILGYIAFAAGLLLGVLNLEFAIGFFLATVAWAPCYRRLRSFGEDTPRAVSSMASPH